MASPQELPFIWITAFWKGTLGQCCKHLPGSKMLHRWTRKVGWPKSTTWQSTVNEFENDITGSITVPQIIFIVCLPPDVTTWLLCVLQASCPSPWFQCTGPPFQKHIWEREFTKHVPYHLKFWMTSPVLPCQRWANTTFKSLSNPRHQLTMIPLLEIFPMMMC